MSRLMWLQLLITYCFDPASRSAAAVSGSCRDDSRIKAYNSVVNSKLGDILGVPCSVQLWYRGQRWQYCVASGRHGGAT